MGGALSNSSYTQNMEITPDRWCTTPFFTRTRRLGELDQSLFLLADLIILALNLLFACSVLKIIKSTITRIQRKPCMWLLYHLAFNDIIFTIVAQSSYAAKLMLPRLNCSFDLTAMFFSQSLSNTSIALIVEVSILRYLSTKHLLSMSLILTLKRAKILLMVAICYGVAFSGLLLWGSIIDNLVVINLPPCLTDICVPIIIPMFYNRAMVIAQGRRGTIYEKGRISLAENTLRKVTIYTLMTYVPFRLCFFVTSTFKMVYTVELENNSTYLLQFFHSASYLILCMTPVGNSILYILSDRRARRIVNTWKRYLKSFLSTRLSIDIRSRSVAANL
ncbi:uncharacterized protein [Clytia hemisphaerica]|uniref:uncharacterized protein n=1 Tax=Clytia hemisphaerica TaxID=252671 RepID=UPI0034D5520E